MIIMVSVNMLCSCKCVIHAMSSSYPAVLTQYQAVTAKQANLFLGGVVFKNTQKKCKLSYQYFHTSMLTRPMLRKGTHTPISPLRADIHTQDTETRQTKRTQHTKSSLPLDYAIVYHCEFFRLARRVST